MKIVNIIPTNNRSENGQFTMDITICSFWFVALLSIWSSKCLQKNSQITDHAYFQFTIVLGLIVWSKQDSYKWFYCPDL